MEQRISKETVFLNFKFARKNTRKATPFFVQKIKKTKSNFYSSLLFTVLLHIEKVDRFFRSPEAGGAH